MILLYISMAIKFDSYIKMKYSKMSSFSVTVEIFKLFA